MKKNQYEALSIVDTNTPFDGVVKVSVIEKRNGIHFKRVIQWTDTTNSISIKGESVPQRNFYFNKSFESYRLSDGRFCMPHFYEFEKGFANPVDFYSDHILHDVDPLHGDIVKSELKKISVNLKSKKTKEKGVLKFLDLLQTIQGESLAITDTCFNCLFMVTIAERGTPSANEIAMFESYAEGLGVACLPQRSKVLTLGKVVIYCDERIECRDADGKIKSYPINGKKRWCHIQKLADANGDYVKMDNNFLQAFNSGHAQKFIDDLVISEAKEKGIKGNGCYRLKI